MKTDRLEQRPVLDVLRDSQADIVDGRLSDFDAYLQKAKQRVRKAVEELAVAAAPSATPDA